MTELLACRELMSATGRRLVRPGLGSSARSDPRRSAIPHWVKLSPVRASFEGDSRQFAQPSEPAGRQRSGESRHDAAQLFQIRLTDIPSHFIRPRMLGKLDRAQSSSATRCDADQL